MPITFVSLICANCDKNFSKSLGDYNAGIRMGRERFFCSLSCMGETRSKEHVPKPKLPKLPKLKKKDARLDEYSVFRWFSNRVRQRTKKKSHKWGTSVSEVYLKVVWDLQGGICPFTKKMMILPHNGTGGWNELSPYNASLDRIDNSMGYVEGNVRFVSLMANYGRNNFSDEQFASFCKTVAATHPKQTITKVA